MYTSSELMPLAQYYLSNKASGTLQLNHVVAVDQCCIHYLSEQDIG